VKTLSPVAKPGAQLRPEARDPFFRRQSQPGSTFFAPAVQARLEVSQPGDPHEVEADRMAEHVMRSLSEPFFAPASPATSAPVPAISRVPTPPSGAATDEEPATKEEEEASDSIPRMADPWFSGGANDDESAPDSPPIQRRAMGPASLAIGALPVSHFAAQSRANSRKTPVPAQATISSGWVTRTPARSRPDRARGPPGGGESFTNLLSQSKGRGQPLSKQSRAEMEPAFGADFGAVRVHTGDEAHSLANRASALAFAHGGDIYFGRGQFQPDTTPGRRLLAHELTHVVQQGGAVQRSPIQRSPFASSLAQRSNHARAPPQISSAEPQVQRLGWSDIKEEINFYAELIHGYTLMTVLVGYNPILDEEVEWTPNNFFRGAAGLIPFGTLIFDKLDEAGVIDSVFAWITSQIDAYNLTLARVDSLFSQAWDQMDFVRLDPVDYNVGVVRSTFSGILSDVAVFASACIDKLIEVFKGLAIKAVRALFGAIAPVYDLICQVLGQDPLTGETREWNTADFLRSVLRLFGFENHLAKMEETGQVEKAAAWIEMQVGLLVAAYGGLIFGVIDLWTSLTLEKFVHPDELLSKTLSIVLTYVGNLAQFAFNLASKVLELIKEALITLLKAHVHKVPGYPLFTVVLGMDPVTGEEVPRTPENFLKGFLSFVPKGIETYENIKASGALPKAMEWLLSLINELGLSPSHLLERFLTLWHSFSIDDLMNPIGAYIRIAEAYLSYVADVMMLVLRVYWKVLEIMFVFLLGPGAARVVAALKQGENTFRLIIEDPVGFFGNLLAAIGKGIKQFGSNIWKHIQGGLIGWMLGSLQGAGIEMPEKFDLQGVVSIVMQLLGLTYRQIRPILVKRLGENVVENLEKTFEFLRLFLTEGFAGVWRQFLEWVGDLKGIVIQAVTEWVVTKIVMVGLSKLATLWNPVGWAVEAVLAIYYTIMFFIERMEQILDFVEAVIQSINNIATGKLQQAADYVENAMARTIPVIISFCTSLIGLGGISSKIRGVIQKIQDKVHKAIDKMIEWIVKQAGALIKKGKAGVETVTAALGKWFGFEKTFKIKSGTQHSVKFQKSGEKIEIVMASSLWQRIKDWFASLIVLARRNNAPEKQIEQLTAASNTAQSVEEKAEQLPEGPSKEEQLAAALQALTEELESLEVLQYSADVLPYVSDFPPEIREAIDRFANTSDTKAPYELSVSKLHESSNGISRPAATAILQNSNIDYGRKADAGHDPETESVLITGPDNQQDFRVMIRVSDTDSIISLVHEINHAFDMRARRTLPTKRVVISDQGEFRRVTAIADFEEFSQEAEKHRKGVASDPELAAVYLVNKFGYSVAEISNHIRTIQLTKGYPSRAEFTIHDRLKAMTVRNSIGLIIGYVTLANWSFKRATTEIEITSAVSEATKSLLEHFITRQNPELKPAYNKLATQLKQLDEGSTDWAKENLTWAHEMWKALKDHKGRTGDLVEDILYRKRKQGLPIGPKDQKAEDEADKMADFVTANENRLGSGERPDLSCRASAHRSGAILAKPGVSHSRRSAVGTVGLQEELRASKGAGRSVPRQIRSRMESMIGADFSTVRIHDQSSDERLAERLNARAFTVGSDIYFNRGEYTPHTRAGRHLLAHELTHVVQQTGPGAATSIQRQADPAHDLTSPGLSGEPKLEEIFDEQGSLRPPAKGPEVTKVQEALLALGLALPKFGADGDYGSETREAVREFQTKAGLTGAQVDGIVGPITLGLLDRASRQGSVTTDTDAAEQDLKVTGKATSKLEDHLNKDGTPKEPVRVFFEFDSDKVTSDEKDKLKALHEKFPAQTLTMKGLASEEGSASYNLALADRRRESVKTVLRDEHKHDAALLVDHPPEVAKRKYRIQRDARR
jgi:outer membrane protein OmpA-like peptidoglycan-associated protein